MQQQQMDKKPNLCNNDIEKSKLVNLVTILEYFSGGHYGL